MKSFNRIKQLNRVVCSLIDEIGINNAVVADIGADHGYLAEILSRNDKISRVVATDISEKCLAKTEKLKKDNSLEKIETRIGDGLVPIETADIVVLAGIGGYEIINILSNQNITKNNDKKCRFFVLCPSDNTADIRRWIFDNKIKLMRDFVVESGGRFYSILVVDCLEKEDNEGTVFNLFFGRDNKIESADFIGFLKFYKELLSFIESMTKEQIEKSDDLKLKEQIYTEINNLLQKIRR